ncbi:MAG: TIGR02646 family protein [Acidobacteriaceae bacterium]|nr:TIGR02646 family protein [Acidobacteriaceae bacterium]
MVHTPRHCEAPAELLARRSRWTDRLKKVLEGKRPDDWATKRAKQLLRPILYELAHGKCVYCEGALDVTSDSHIEHYISRAVDPDQAFDWMNLLPGCSKCNIAKGAQDHGNLLLKPDIEDPEPYFWMHPDTGELQPHPSLDSAAAARARRTIELCKLQRPALCSERLRMLGRAVRWLTQLAAASEMTAHLHDEWQELSDPRMTYKFVLRHALTLRGQAALAQQDRLSFEDKRRVYRSLAVNIKPAR